MSTCIIIITTVSHDGSKPSLGYIALSATRRLANRVSLCSELSAARRSLRRSVLMSEFAAYLAISATRRFANRVSLSSELSAARRSLLLQGCHKLGFYPSSRIFNTCQSYSDGFVGVFGFTYVGSTRIT